MGMLAGMAMGGASLRAEDRPALVRLRFTKSDIRDLLSFYSRLIRKPVLVEVDMPALVTVAPDEDLPLKDAIELVRKTLLESYGIEMRDSDRGEVLVTWSSDPKYPHRSDPPARDIDRRFYQEKGIQLLDPAASK